MSGSLIETAEPVWAPAPGQAAVLYDGEECLGGGRIARADMTPWMVLTVLVAAINLTAFTAPARSLGPAAAHLVLASLLAPPPATRSGRGPASSWCGSATSIWSLGLPGAQLAMLATDLLAQLGPSRPPPDRRARGGRDGDRTDR